MKICFPVQQDDGLESSVYGHFGSAPLFLIVDDASRAVVAVGNRDLHHAKGVCNPLKALEGQSVDAVVVGGIGAGALSRLRLAGVRVFRASPVTVRQNLALLTEGALSEWTLQTTCAGHGPAGGCSHH